MTESADVSKKLHKSVLLSQSQEVSTGFVDVIKVNSCALLSLTLKYGTIYSMPHCPLWYNFKMDTLPSAWNGLNLLVPLSPTFCPSF